MANRYASLYLIIIYRNFILRATVLMMAGPVLARIGYGLSWQNAVILCWGGLRGAVGLALALQVALDYKSVGNKVRNPV